MIPTLLRGPSDELTPPPPGITFDDLAAYDFMARVLMATLTVEQIAIAAHRHSKAARVALWLLTWSPDRMEAKEAREAIEGLGEMPVNPGGVS